MTVWKTKERVRQRTTPVKKAEKTSLSLEGKVSLRKKAKPRPMKTIQPSMWLQMLPV